MQTGGGWTHMNRSGWAIARLPSLRQHLLAAKPKRTVCRVVGGGGGGVIGWGTGILAAGHAPRLSRLQFHGKGGCLETCGMQETSGKRPVREHRRLACTRSVLLPPSPPLTFPLPSPTERQATQRSKRLACLLLFTRLLVGAERSRSSTLFLSTPEL